MTRHDPPASQGTEAFDAFLAESWRPLLLQTFAVCGDPASARAGLRHAFSDAWQHWSRAERRGPEAYVRQLAMARATTLTGTRPHSRTGSKTPEQLATLAALHELPYDQRVAVVLACLTDLPVHAIGREIDATPAETDRTLDVGLEQAARALARPIEALPTRLRELEPAVRGAAQPQGRDVRKRGARRSRVFLAAGAVATVVAVVLAGVFLLPDGDDGGDTPAPTLGPSVTASLLLATADLSPVAPAVDWRTLSTTNNTAGTGLNVACQKKRFADPQGLKTLVRTFSLTGDVPRTASQTVELSRTKDKAHDAYVTAVRWFAGCEKAQTQLVSAYRVDGLADEATMLTFRTQGTARSVFGVGLARTGNLTTWTALTAPGDRTTRPAKLSTVLTTAVRKACGSRAAGTCPAAAQAPTVTEVPPPPSGEQPGMLSTVDLPPIGSVQRPWVGTEASGAAITSNAAATSCDRTSFAQARANPIRSRTYLIPDAPLPPRFGVTETYGRFTTPAQAKALLRQITTRMDGCETKDLGATVSDRATSRPKAAYPFAMWRLQSKISQTDAITYWMGAVQVGPYLAQIGFVPGGSGQDITAATFQAMVVRARDRLVELATAVQSASPSGSPSSGSPSSPTPSAPTSTSTRAASS